MKEEPKSYWRVEDGERVIYFFLEPVKPACKSCFNEDVVKNVLLLKKFINSTKMKSVKKHTWRQSKIGDVADVIKSVRKLTNKFSDSLHYLSKSKLRGRKNQVMQFKK